MDAREQLLENARAALRGGRLAEGERHCRESIARWPDWPEPYTLLAAARLHAGAPGEAFEIGAAAERQGAASAELFNQLAGTRRQQGDRDGAARDYRRATDLRPEWFAPWANLGLLLQDAGRDAEADSAFAEALARDPDVAELWNNRGNIALAQGRFEDALDALGRARDLRPDWPLPHYNLGLVYEALHRFDEAAAALDACLARDPTYADARRALSAVRIRQRRHGAAVEAAAQAVALAPTAENLVALGVAHRAAGDPDAADAAFVRALEAEPANAVAAWHRAILVPVLCRDAAEAAAARARLHDGLAMVAAAADPATLWPALSSATLFNAHYLGVARENQETCGAIVARTLAAACPDLLRLPPAQRRDRPRVGFVSSLLRDHTVGKLFGGWLGLDRDRFEVVLYDTGGAPDAAAERFAAAADRARHLRGDTLAITRAIRDDAPDILISPRSAWYRTSCCSPPCAWHRCRPPAGATR